MGMFDNIQYKGDEYQTKDTPSQLLDNYKIEQDQTSGHWFLWHEEYDVDWVEEPDRFGGGYMKQSNHRWVHCAEFDGNLRFYNSDREYRTLFMDGKMIKIKEVFDEPLTNWYKDGVEQKGLK
jgi:hypothetical protein